jgi:hypothetical protein
MTWATRSGMTQTMAAARCGLGPPCASILGLVLFLFLACQTFVVLVADEAQNGRTEALPERLVNDDLVKKDPRVRKLIEEKGDNAIIFLQEMLKDGPTQFQYEQFLEKILDPKLLPDSVAQIELAQKLVEKMGVLVTEDDWQNLGSHVDLLIDLVSKGPESFRKTLRETLLIFIREEEAQGKRETIDKLGQKLVRNYAPSPEEIREISRILWHADGWSLVDFLMAGLELNRENALRDPTTVSGYIIELRRRLLLDWSTVDDWASWWQQNEGDSIETILAASQRAYVKRRVALWRKNLRRFRDLADPAAYFKALEESFASDSLEEARIAVLDELAEFPSWLKELRLDLATFDEAAREKLLESGVELLLEVLEGIGAYTHESISVRTSTMAALGAFAEVIGDRDDSSVRGEFREKVVAALLRDRDTHEPLDLTAWDEDGHQYRVEFIRTVGLLGVSEVHESLRALLEKSATAVSKEDFAVLQEAVASLGKILKGNKIADVNRDVSQILALYELARARDERAKKDRQNQYSLRGLRKTCINAVHLPVTDSETLLEVRGVYRKILSPYAKDVPERIPAIIGLGILAENDEASRQVLISVLNERDEYEPNEVNTAVNALAYLGDRKALGCFVEFLPARDRPFADQVWKRAVNILKRGSPELRAWLVAELEKSGFESGSTDYAWVIVGLGKEPGLEGLFLSEKNNWDDIESLWRSALSEIAALGLLGQEDGAIARVEQLRRFWARNNKVVKLDADVDATFDAFDKDLKQKKAFSVALQRTPAVPLGELQDLLLTTVRKDGNPSQRWQRLAWVQLQLQQLRPSKSTREMVAGYLTQVTDDASYWTGIPDESRKRYLKSIAEIQAKLPDLADLPE